MIQTIVPSTELKEKLTISRLKLKTGQKGKQLFLRASETSRAVSNEAILVVSHSSSNS